VSDELDEIQAIFFEECTEGLTTAEQGLSAMQAGDVSAETIAGVFRAVHSIKGGAGAFGHADLTAFAHKFENVLDEVRGGKIAPTPGVVKVMLSSFDVLADHVETAKGLAPRPNDAAALAALEGARQQGRGRFRRSANSAPAAPAGVETRPGRRCTRRGEPRTSSASAGRVRARRFRRAGRACGFGRELDDPLQAVARRAGQCRRAVADRSASSRRSARRSSRSTSRRAAAARSRSRGRLFHLGAEHAGRGAADRHRRLLRFRRTGFADRRSRATKSRPLPPFEPDPASPRSSRSPRRSRKRFRSCRSRPRSRTSPRIQQVVARSRRRR
jgi:chemotaxis protein histidine kinase CheA